VAARSARWWWWPLAAESFIAPSKTKFIAECIEIFYNRQQLHSSLDYRNFAEALTDYQTRTVV
jgi:hypothetical protein